MCVSYSLKESGRDCLVNIKLPLELYESLCTRAKVFGRKLEIELKLRLVRSLLKDDLRDRTDELLQAIYYSEES